MGIIGFEFTGIDGCSCEIQEKDKDTEIKMNLTPHIEHVEKREIYLKEVKNTLQISFSFHIDYLPDIGHMRFTGRIIYQSPDVSKIHDQWQKHETLDTTVAADVLNAIFRKCLIRAIDMAEELRLPAPLQIPTVKIEKPVPKSVGKK